MYAQFKLSQQEEYQSYTTVDETNIIRALSKINFFIGPNNSGKSRLLRQLLIDLVRLSPLATPDLNWKEVAGTQLAVSTVSFQRIKEVLASDLPKIDSCIMNEQYRQEIYKYLELETSTELDELQLADFYAGFLKLLNKVRYDFDKVALQTDPKERKREEYVNKLFSYLLGLILNLFPKHQEYHFTYVPTLRTLRKFPKITEPPANAKKGWNFDHRKYYETIDEPIFRSRTAFDYFRSIENFLPEIFFNESELNDFAANVRYHTFIFSGESLFDEIRRLRNSGENVRKILRDFEQFLSVSFFEGQLVELNSLDIDGIKDVYIKIGKEQEFPIFHLGDGIQAIILLTFPLFVNADKPHQIFYEEPELFLHPGMQRIFIEVLRRFDKTQIYIATHSNHFLDTSLDFPESISIFSLSKNLGNETNAKFRIENLSSPNISILNALGVRNSSVLLANCTIWVEGISDRLYLKKYLSTYLAENPDNDRHHLQFNEDLHYSFFEFGGNNITHYCFMQEPSSDKIAAHFLSNRIFLIHDRDTGKEKRHKMLQETLNDNYYVLNALEVENLLSPSVLQACLNDFADPNIEGVSIPLIDKEEYESVALGTVVAKNIPTGLRKIFSTGGPGKTPVLYNKLEFARKALLHIQTWGDLSEEAQQLTRKIYAFIKINNHHH